MTTSLPFITECTRLLLAGGADIHAVDMGGNNVLHYASAGDNFSFLQASSSAPLRRLQFWRLYFSLDP